jgi:hypothetical protein
LAAAYEYGPRLAEEYYEDIDIWPDPVEAATFELTCWYWLRNEYEHLH